ncbi:hypothetical protein [Nonomuraea bangladeshensis]|uniref:hypothetical protein n=1 Tax=Nonomuraea bangladeshensis TaxID=404385 RepID=UPI003C3091CC
MLAHISADRDNALIVSFPRDSLVQLPACKAKPAQHLAGQLPHLGTRCSSSAYTATPAGVSSSTWCCPSGQLLGKFTRGTVLSASHTSCNASAGSSNHRGRPTAASRRLSTPITAPPS